MLQRVAIKNIQTGSVTATPYEIFANVYNCKLKPKVNQYKDIQLYFSNVQYFAYLTHVNFIYYVTCLYEIVFRHYPSS